ncbi:MAG: DUF4924 family protein [Muribaculaceae bacterium]|nr:DUF4924 family protein [Muribaculaceae bacterium]
MLIASQLRKENIAQYLLYMWQIEDLIRANGLDIDRIKASVIDPYKLNPEQEKQMIDWYDSLIDMMRREEVVEKGHLQINRNTIGDLADLHRRIMADPRPRFDKYHKEFYNTLPFIVELRAKAGDNRASEIETCFNALYGILMLRLAKKDISQETAKAFEQISAFVALLSHYHKLDETEDIFKEDDKK